MKIKNQKTGRYNQTYIYPFLQDDATDEETFLKGHIFVVDNEIQINLGLGNYSIDQIKNVRDALDIAIKVAEEGEAEEIEIFRNTVMTYRNVERVLIDSEIDGFKYFCDNSISVEIFFVDGSSMISSICRHYWDMNLQQLERYINGARLAARNP